MLIYKECLYHKIGKSGLFVENENPSPLVFEEVKLECGIERVIGREKLMVGIKSIAILHDVHLAKTLAHVKLG